MKFKAIVSLLLILLLATPVLAEKSASKRFGEDAAITGPGGLDGATYRGRDLFEGFEGVFPPEGWTLESTNTATWDVMGDGWGLEGSFSAVANWTYTEPTQDERLSFQHTVDVAGGEHVLSFWAAGSTGESWDLNSTETVEIDGVEVWSFDDEVPYAHHFYFHQYFIDLSDYDGQTVTITFRYAGLDGDSFFLDAVTLDNGIGWQPDLPEAPLNDTCESALDNAFFIPAGDFSFQADNTTARRDYALPANSCLSYGFHGQDLVWIVCMEPGDVLNITMEPADVWDSEMFLVSDCGDPLGSCTAIAGEPSVMNFTAVEEGTYYIITGGWTLDMEGPFTLYGNLVGDGCDTIATDDSTWSEVKSLYR